MSFLPFTSAFARLKRNDDPQVTEARERQKELDRAAKRREAVAKSEGQVRQLEEEERMFSALDLKPKKGGLPMRSPIRPSSSPKRLELKEDQAILDVMGGKGIEKTPRAQKLLDVNERYTSTIARIKDIEKQVRKGPGTKTGAGTLNLGGGISGHDQEPDIDYLENQRNSLIEALIAMEDEGRGISGTMDAKDWESIEREDALRNAIFTANKEENEKRNAEFRKAPGGQALGEAVTEPVKAGVSLFEMFPGVVNQYEKFTKGRTSEMQKVIAEERERASSPETFAGKASGNISALAKFGVEAYTTGQVLSGLGLLSKTGGASKIAGGKAILSPTLPQKMAHGAAVFGTREAAVQTFEGLGYEPEQIVTEAALGAVFEGFIAPALGRFARRVNSKAIGQETFIYRPGTGALPSGAKIPGGQTAIPKDVQTVATKFMNKVKGIERQVIFKMNDGAVHEMRITPMGNGQARLDLTRGAPGWLGQYAKGIMNRFNGRDVKNGNIVEAKVAKKPAEGFKFDIDTNRNLPVVVDGAHPVDVPTHNKEFFSAGIMNIRRFMGGELYQRHSQLFDTSAFINSEEAVEVTRQYFGDGEVPVEVVERIVTPEGERALGKYREGMISFVENPHESTPHHEAVHAYLDLFAGRDAKQDILQHVMDDKGIVGAVEAEEVLADGFVEYVRTGKTKGFTRRVIEYFKDIWAKMQGFFKEPDKVRQLYRDIILKRRRSEVRPGTSTTPEVHEYRLATYQQPEKLSTKLLKEISDRDVVSRQFIEDQLRRTQDFKKAELDIIQEVLDTQFRGEGKISVADLRDAVRTELLPLEQSIYTESTDSPYYQGNGNDKFTKFSSTTMPEDLRGNVYDYQEIVWQSPFEHGLHNHFGDNKYFAHSRSEDMHNGDLRIERATELTEPNKSTMVGGTRRVIEMQSDLYQHNEIADILLSSKGKQSIMTELERAESSLTGSRGQVDVHRKMIDWLEKNAPDKITEQDFLKMKEEVGEGGGFGSLMQLAKSDLFLGAGNESVTKQQFIGHVKESLQESEKRLETSEEENGAIIKEKQRQLAEFNETEKRLLIPEAQKLLNEYQKLQSDERALSKRIQDFKDTISSRRARVELNEESLAKVESKSEKLYHSEQIKNAKSDLRDAEVELARSEDALERVIPELEKAKTAYQEINAKQISKMTSTEKGIMNYRQRWFERVAKEEIRRAALDGKTAVQFPTGKTAALVEGFLNEGGGIPEDTSFGGEVEYQGMEMRVVKTYYDGVELVDPDKIVWEGSLHDWQSGEEESFREMVRDDPLEDISFDDIQQFAEENGVEIRNWIDEGKNGTEQMEIKKQEQEKLEAIDEWEHFVDEKADEIAEQRASDSHPEDVYGSDNVYQDDAGNDNIIAVEHGTHTESVSYQQGGDYFDFDPENLGDSERAIVDFYDKQVAKFLNKYRKGNIQVIEDDRGVEWLETQITPEDGGPVEAYQTPQQDIFGGEKTPEQIKVEENKGLQREELAKRVAESQRAIQGGSVPDKRVQPEAFPETVQGQDSLFQRLPDLPNNPEYQASKNELKNKTKALEDVISSMEKELGVAEAVNPDAERLVGLANDIRQVVASAPRLPGGIRRERFLNELAESGDNVTAVKDRLQNLVDNTKSASLRTGLSRIVHRMGSGEYDSLDYAPFSDAIAGRATGTKNGKVDVFERAERLIDQIGDFDIEEGKTLTDLLDEIDVLEFKIDDQIQQSKAQSKGAKQDRSQNRKSPDRLQKRVEARERETATGRELLKELKKLAPGKEKEFKVILRKAISEGKKAQRNKDAKALKSARDEIVKIKDHVKKEIAEAKKEVRSKEKKLAQDRVNRVLFRLNKVTRRRDQVRIVKKFFGLSDSAVRKIGGSKDVRFMDDAEFNQFISRFAEQAEIEAGLSIRRAEAKDFINRMELFKVDNLRKALKLPEISQMSLKQLDKFMAAMEDVEFRDEFLTQRQIETLKNTPLKGAKTVREIKKSLADRVGMEVEDLEITVGWFDRFRYDSSFAEQNPFYDLIVEETNRAMFETEAAYLFSEKKINELVNAARKSRDRGLVKRAVPTDELIFEYLEASNKRAVVNKMTDQEIEAAKYIRNEYKMMRDYLIKNEMLDRYIEDYITHIRRGFLETWADDGFVKGITEFFEQNKEDKAVFNILSDTGEILPLEKFFQFSLRRTGEIEPTKNVAKAFLAYRQTFEKKRALDSIMPMLDVYVSAITPRRYTPRGLEYDRSLKKIYNEWMNNKKGRRTTLGSVLPQGGTIDVIIRSLKAFTTMIDIGLSLPIGIASQVGEQSMNVVMLGTNNYVKGSKRMTTKQGKKISKKYDNFIGRGPFEEFADAAKHIGNKTMSAMFILFRDAQVRANKQFLLGSLTKEEFNSGEISAKRLAELKKEMGRWRVTEQSKSIVGATSLGGAITHYKTWAVPILRTGIANMEAVIKDPKKIKSKEGRELLRAGILTTFFGLLALSAVNEDDNTFLGKTIGKMIRDGMSLLGAFDPDTWLGTPRTLQFLQKLTKGMKQLAVLEEYSTSGRGYKKGDLKGMNTIKRELTPKVIKQFLPEEKAPTKKKGGRSRTTANRSRSTSMAKSRARQ